MREMKTLTHPYTLSELISEYGANGFILADAGNGCGSGEAGRFTEYDDATAEKYAETKMTMLDDMHMSDDGFECYYASEWTDEGEGDNPYRVRIYF